MVIARPGNDPGLELILNPLDLLDRLVRLVTPPQAEIQLDQAAGLPEWPDWTRPQVRQVVSGTGSTNPPTMMEEAYPERETAYCDFDCEKRELFGKLVSWRRPCR